MFNFKNGTALAVQQDQYIQKYLAGEKLNSKEICDMEQNLWVAAASKLSPCNLVIRQWALIDLFKESAKHKENIRKMMDILTYKEKEGYDIYEKGEDYKIFAESYSYFGYTMDVLKLWIEKFESFCDITDIKGTIDKINQGFIVTSYPRNGIWYPAPFGDLRDIPLKPDLQISHEMNTLAISNIIFNYAALDDLVWYSIKGQPIGCNTHIPKNNSVIRIQNGIPVDFKFYEGYDKKYKNSWEEYKDTFDPKRLMSIPF
jgi:hypothetical protein